MFLLVCVCSEHMDRVVAEPLSGPRCRTIPGTQRVRCFRRGHRAQRCTRLRVAAKYCVAPARSLSADSTLLTNWRRKASASLLPPSACSSSHTTSSSAVSLPFLRFHAARVFWHIT